MSIPQAQIIQQLNKAKILHQQNKIEEAESTYQNLLTVSPDNEDILFPLAQLYLQTARIEDASDILKRLCIQVPNKVHYCDLLANTYAQLKKFDQACNCYLSFLQNNSGTANTFFNYAYFLKSAGQYEEAIAQYKNALKHNIAQPEEIYVNMAVIYSDNLHLVNKAIEALETAINIKPEFVPAIYNLASIYEERGDKDLACRYYQEILAIIPNDPKVQARLAENKTFTNSNSDLARSIKANLSNKFLDTESKIDLNFALGKIHNDSKEYDTAFDYYQKANQLSAAHAPQYNRIGQEQNTSDNIKLFGKDWFENAPVQTDESPIFICGMFRSGSTLTEQILAAHPAITPGGELDIIPSLVAENLNSYPNSMSEITKGELEKFSGTYLSQVKKLFPDAIKITDKRPDNFLYLGLVKTLFPKAKIIYTSRNPVDNCLSVYFLQLAREMNYATDLDDVAHYYSQHRRLMAHWKSLFPETIYEVNYEDLVQAPKQSISSLLDFLDLEWNDACLKFHKLTNPVKTASIWQVRQPIYQSSTGRWKNYQKQVNSIQWLLNNKY